MSIKKKADFQGIIIIFFIALIVFALIAVFGFKSIFSLSERKCQTDLAILESKLKTDFDIISTQTGSVDKGEYNMPCKIEKVYFIDLNEQIDEDIKNESKVIYDSAIAKVEKNVFFMKENKIITSVYIPELKLSYPYYRCFETAKNEKMSVYLEGKGRGTNIEHVNHYFNCGYIPVLMENETLIDDIKTKTETETTVSFPSDYKDRIEKTRENVFLGRKVDIKKDGTNIKIRIKPFDKTAKDLIYIEDIPKECIEDLGGYLGLDPFGVPLIKILFEGGAPPGARNWQWKPDPIIVWHFGPDEQITDKEEIEYELDEQVDCMRIINALGFGEIS